MDRTVATGTGYTGQYRPEVARVFENLASTPDDIVLFFHHVPYTYVLHSGKTVIQTIYDMHYDGQEAVEGYVHEWRRLGSRIDEERRNAVLAQLEYQAGQAEVWQDAVNTWFFKASGIPDAQRRVGNSPDRIEAESMTLDGYTPVDVTPSEDASGGKAVSCSAKTCSASFKYKFGCGYFALHPGGPGVYDIRIEYFDQSTGSAHYRVFVNDKMIDEWTADMRMLPGRNDARLDSTSSTRHTFPDLRCAMATSSASKALRTGAKPLPSTTSSSLLPNNVLARSRYRHRRIARHPRRSRRQTDRRGHRSARRHAHGAAALRRAAPGKLVGRGAARDSRRSSPRPAQPVRKSVASASPAKCTAR